LHIAVIFYLKNTQTQNTAIPVLWINKKRYFFFFFFLFSPRTALIQGVKKVWGGISLIQTFIQILSGILRVWGKQG